MQRAEHAACFAMAVAGLHTAEAEGLQVADGVGTALVSGDDVVHLQGPLVFVHPAAFAAAPGASVNPVLHRAADRSAVSRAMGKHLCAALLAEGVEALASQLLKLVALGVAQLLAAHKVVGALVVAGDAVAGEHLAHHALHPFGVVVDLGHVFAQDPGGYVLRCGCWGARFGFGRPARQVPLLGTPSGVGAWRLQPTRLLVKACRPSPFA